MSQQAIDQLVNTKDRSRIHYRTFHNIFLYITEQCQLRCNHCYMGDRLDRGLSISYDKIEKIMTHCRKLGAKYITFVGGEPTLHPELSKIVKCAKSIGYDKVHIDTNGLNATKLMNIPPEEISYIRVSLDGATSVTHDKIRGNGTYEKTISSIKQLVKAGYKVGITCTIFKFNIHEAPNLLSLADDLGVSVVNYHVFSEEGRGIKNSHWSLSPHSWIDFYQNLEKIKHNYKTSIWYPPTWASREKLNTFINEGYQGCLGCYLDRLSIFPDGKCYVCSVLFDLPVNYGQITDTGLILNRNKNEFEMFTKAMFQSKEAWLSGCPAEKILEKNGKIETPNDLISICRCWKSQI